MTYPAAHALAAAIALESTDYAAHRTPVHVPGTGPVMRDCQLCGGDGFVILDDTGWARSRRITCPDCEGAKVLPVPCCACGGDVQLPAVAIEDGRLDAASGLRRQWAEWCCGECAAMGLQACDAEVE